MVSKYFIVEGIGKYLFGKSLVAILLGRGLAGISLGRGLAGISFHDISLRGLAAVSLIVVHRSQFLY